MCKLKRQRAIVALQRYVDKCRQQPSMQGQHLSGAGATHCLEEKLRVYYSKKYAVTFCNATTALQTLCLAMNLNNTEILTSPINWGGSISPFLLHGNKLRFTSYNPSSLNLAITDLPHAITKNTKAVLSVDYNGVPVDSETIKTFCTQNNLMYISDSSQSFGALFNNKPAGFFGDAIVLSFTSGKSFFAGEGGAVITDNAAIYEKLLWYSQHPSRQKTVFGLSNFNEYAPINGRMNPLSAVLLNETFKSNCKALKKFQIKCFRLIQQLQAGNFIEATPCIPDPTASTFFCISVKLTEKSSLKQINMFLKQQDKSFHADEYSPKILPFDNSFRKQFSGKFSCSNALIEQRNTSQQRDWLRLIYSPSLV